MEKKKLLVSACLLGTPCRYDGRSKPCEGVLALMEKYEFVPVCPECEGGLPTPRTPSERVGESVIMADGTDVTEEYFRGARIAYNRAAECGAAVAVLKARSPSCGKGEIYDGSFMHTLTQRHGVCAEYLIERGIEVFTEEELENL